MQGAQQSSGPRPAHSGAVIHMIHVAWLLGKWTYVSGNLGGRQNLCFDSSRNGWRALLPAVIKIIWKLKRFALIGNNVYERYSEIHHFIQNDPNCLEG